MKRIIIALLLLCGCYVARYPVTPSVVEASTYLLVEEGSTGTAWAVDEHHAVTAGHMCEGLRTPGVLISSIGRRIPVEGFYWEYSETNGYADICIMESRAPLAQGLVIADRMPRIGGWVGYVGYPLGEHASRYGKYVGDVDGDGSNMNDDVITAECDHGASGSPAYYGDGVFGVIVRLRTDGDFIHPPTDGCVVAPLDELRDVLEAAGINYARPPVPPDPAW